LKFGGYYQLLGRIAFVDGKTSCKKFLKAELTAGFEGFEKVCPRHIKPFANLMIYGETTCKG
jgi:hypothetical protein